MTLAAAALVALTSSYVMAADTTVKTGAGVTATAPAADGSATVSGPANVTLGTDATANASADTLAKMTPDQQNDIKKTCSGEKLTDAVKKDCMAFGVIK